MCCLQHSKHKDLGNGTQWDADLITDNYSTCICSVRMSNMSFFLLCIYLSSWKTTWCSLIWNFRVTSLSTKQKSAKCVMFPLVHAVIYSVDTLSNKNALFGFVFSILLLAKLAIFLFILFCLNIIKQAATLAVHSAVIHQQPLFSTNWTILDHCFWFNREQKKGLPQFILSSRFICHTPTCLFPPCCPAESDDSTVCSMHAIYVCVCVRVRVPPPQHSSKHVRIVCGGGGCRGGT